LVKMEICTQKSKLDPVSYVLFLVLMYAYTLMKTLYTFIFLSINIYNEIIRIHPIIFNSYIISHKFILAFPFLFLTF
jgi:hypothetical protein